MGLNTEVSLQPCQQVYCFSFHSAFYFYIFYGIFFLFI
jgi:hypothetical protein